jgi:uncharacterized protein YodC (DUF2158 family)
MFTMKGIADSNDGVWVTHTGEKVILTGQSKGHYTEDLAIGDVVRLITGGPLMTVVDVCECGEVNTVWFIHDGECWHGPLGDTFPSETLELVDG